MHDRVYYVLGFVTVVYRLLDCFFVPFLGVCVYDYITL